MHTIFCSSVTSRGPARCPTWRSLAERPFSRPHPGGLEEDDGGPGDDCLPLAEGADGPGAGRVPHSSCLCPHSCPIPTPRHPDTRQAALCPPVLSRSQQPERGKDLGDCRHPWVTVFTEAWASRAGPWPAHISTRAPPAAGDPAAWAGSALLRGPSSDCPVAATRPTLSCWHHVSL